MAPSLGAAVVVGLSKETENVSAKTPVYFILPSFVLFNGRPVALRPTKSSEGLDDEFGRRTRTGEIAACEHARGFLPVLIASKMDMDRKSVTRGKVWPKLL